VASNP